MLAPVISFSGARRLFASDDLEWRRVQTFYTFRQFGAMGWADFQFLFLGLRQQKADP